MMLGTRSLRTRGDVVNFDSAVQELLDKHALRELVTQYCRAVDRADSKLLLSVYHDDAIDEHGPFAGTPEELLDVLKKWTMNPEKQAQPIQHSITNAVFEVDGDTAYGEVYFEVRKLIKDRPYRAWGRYVDRYERRDSVWRIARRKVILEFTDDKYDASDFTQWYRDRRDPSYDRGGTVSECAVISGRDSHPTTR
jgi:ketosteroid isomerase-like protein